LQQLDRVVMFRRNANPGRETVEDTTHTIGEMCADFSITPRTLRFYEAKELLAPIRDGQRRLYTRRCRARLKLILQGKRFGFSLEDIRQILNLYDIGDQQVSQIARIYELGTERLAAMEAQRVELGEAIADLRQQMKRAEEYLGGHGAASAAE
jgi:DNA-binding transcriptional MerR regulator